MSEKIKETKEPTILDLIRYGQKNPYITIVIMYSGDFDEKPVLLSLQEYCKKFCPLYPKEEDMR